MRSAREISYCCLKCYISMYLLITYLPRRIALSTPSINKTGTKTEFLADIFHAFASGNCLSADRALKGRPFAEDFVYLMLLLGLESLLYR